MEVTEAVMSGTPSEQECWICHMACSPQETTPFKLSKQRYRGEKFCQIQLHSLNYFKWWLRGTIAAPLCAHPIPTSSLTPHPMNNKKHLLGQAISGPPPFPPSEKGGLLMVAQPFPRNLLKCASCRAALQSHEPRICIK